MRAMMMMLYLVGVAFTCQGCAPLWQSARTSLLQPLVYNEGTCDVREIRRNRQLAQTAWGEFASEHPAGCSKDFEGGFKSGFEDFIYWGGTGAPPPMPPRCYWNFKYETPEGHKAIQDWFEGFRVGAASAQKSGYRQLVVVPGSTSLPSSTPQTSPSPPAVPNTSPEPGANPEEVLPPPRQAPSPNGPGTEGPSMIEQLPPPSTSRRLPGKGQPMLQHTSAGMDPAMPLPLAAQKPNG